MNESSADARADMQARLDPLIAERAPWLYSGKAHHRIARRVMMRLLRYPRTIRLAAEL
ncbi:MAG TPA: glycerol acyltransferase, partial [Paracoccus sp.]|nr:glycerol acyltransferase [Paracoccus sp. (in: a-proteobacteria)]